MGILYGILMVVLAIVLLVFLVVVLTLPGAAAKRRNHKSADAINILGWGGLLFFPLWIIALVWAYADGSEPEKNITKGPTRFKINGVDRQTKMDTTWYCLADSKANAQAKAELEGIITTSVEVAM